MESEPYPYVTAIGNGRGDAAALLPLPPSPVVHEVGCPAYYNQGDDGVIFPRVVQSVSRAGLDGLPPNKMCRDCSPSNGNTSRLEMC